MSGIPPDLHQQIRTILLDCGPFDDNSQIRDLFTDARISPWRFSLPSRDNIIARVEAFIAFLAGKHRADDGQNALVLLLHVLSERLDENSDCQPRLTAVANDLAAILGGTRPATVKVTPSRPASAARVRYNDTYTRYEIGLERFEEELGVQHPDYLTFATQQSMLQEQIDIARRTSDTEDRAVRRAEIIARLNQLALATLGKSFNSLCQS